MVLRGEADIGKRAPLDHVREAASGLKVTESSGSELDSEFPFAALHQLCMPLLRHLADLVAGTGKRSKPRSA